MTIKIGKPATRTKKAPVPAPSVAAAEKSLQSQAEKTPGKNLPAVMKVPKFIKVKTGTNAVKEKSAKTKNRKEKKPKKVKMIRDSFTMPENDYSLISTLKQRCLDAGVPVKKSELLRAGLIALSRLNGVSLLKRMVELEKIKTGRPPKTQASSSPV